MQNKYLETVYDNNVKITACTDSFMQLNICVIVNVKVYTN